MFIGRDREMREIESLLARADDVQLRAALDGLPGIGKTELARQVVARLSRGKRFPGGIFWFAAEHSDLRLQWAKIAEDLGAPVLLDLDERAAWAVRHVEHRAQRGEPILIVLDNVETWAPPPGPLPDASAVRLLVTTRTRWLHNSFRPYEVRPLELAHAKQLLDSIVGRNVADSDDLLLALGGHVLSLELAATYLREYGTPPGEYLKQLLVGKSPGDSVADRTSYRATAESAFRLLWQHLTSDLRGAWLLGAQLPPAWFSIEISEAIGLDAERRRGLVRLHILDRDDQGRHQMHRLLREFALAEAQDASPVREAVIAGATKLLKDGDPLLGFRRYSRDAACFEHLLGTDPDDLPSLPLRVASGIALQQLGDLPRARSLFEQALAANRKRYGEDHPEVATSRVGLAGLLRQLGDLPAARVLYEQALASNRKTYGDDHPKVATTRANLAGLLRQLGDLPAARDLYERALASDLKTYGEDHPEVATTRANLAGLHRERGDQSTARVLYEQALASHLKTYGDDHPGVAAIRANLAVLLQELDELPTARILFEQALASNLKTYGDDHPDVATARANLAVLLRQSGNPSPARVLFEQALASHLKTYGNDHPEVAAIHANLAQVLQDLDELPTARVLFERALASHLKPYGNDHPEVAAIHANLAQVLQDLGDLPAARILFEQALASHLKPYGNDHPKVANTRANLARLLENLGDLPAARVLQAKALASDLKTYGTYHPKVTERRATLVRLLRKRLVKEPVLDEPVRESLYVEQDPSKGTVHVGTVPPADSVLIQLALASARRSAR
jgi:tetratricopeptide (TPR) repeat protein